jgi:hypothetical protein
MRPIGRQFWGVPLTRSTGTLAHDRNAQTLQNAARTSESPLTTIAPMLPCAWQEALRRTG